MLGAVAAVVIVVVVVGLLTRGSGNSAPPAQQRSASTGHGSHQAAGAQAGSAARSSLHVVVLNATETNGLAASVAKRLKGKGFRQAAALFGTPEGSYPSTVVQYSQGHAASAREVARALHVAHANVTTMQPAATPLAGGAPVVVIVGEAAAAADGAAAAEATAAAAGESTGETTTALDGESTTETAEVLTDESPASEAVDRETANGGEILPEAAGN